jgi:hypothetical protein
MPPSEAIIFVGVGPCGRSSTQSNETRGCMKEVHNFGAVSRGVAARSAFTKSRGP